MLRNLRNFSNTVFKRRFADCAFLNEFPREVESKIRVGNVDINYLKVGSGQHTALCLPGGLGSIWTDFSAQIAGFDLKKFSLVVWDPPGYGYSRPPERDFTCLNYLEKDADIAAELMKVLKIEKYSVLGWSDGGISGLFLAANHSDNIRKLVVWGSNSYYTNDDVAMFEKIRNTSDWSVSMRNTFTKIYGADLLKKMVNDWVESVVKIVETKNGNLCQDKLKDIKAPTLILHGSKDPLVPEFHPKHLKENIKNSRLHIFENGKHNIHLKYAEEFNKLVQDFLDS